MRDSWRSFLIRTAASIRSSGRDEQEASEELRLHMELLQQQFVERGMTVDEARAAAARQFGRLTTVQEDLREQRTWPLFDHLRRDSTLAWRQVRRSPSFFASVVLTLAIGIGASVTIFGVAHAVLLRALPYRDPEQLVSFQSNRGIKGQPAVSAPDSLSYPDFFDYRSFNRVFSHLVSFRDSQFTLTGTTPAVQVQGEIVSYDLFAALGTKLLYGSGFLPEDERPGVHAVVLSHSLWQERFQGDARVVGETASIGGVPYRIAGVAPKGFQFPPQNPGVQLWVTLADDSATGGSNDPLSVQRGANVLDAIGRLRPGVTISQAKTAMDLIAIRLARQYPDNDGNRQSTYVHPELDSIIGPIRTPLLILCAAVGLLLLVACANVANLLLVRGSERRVEFAMRAALGASRWTILRQWLTETLLLGSVGCGLGLGAAAAALSFVARRMGDVVPRLGESQLSWPVVTFALVLLLLTSLSFSILPASQSFRLQLEHVLRAGSRSVIGRGMRLRNLLVISQVAVSLILLTGAEILMASLLHLQERDSGFQPSHVLTFSIGLNESAYPTRDKQLAFWHRLLTSMEQLPGVRQAATGAALPLAGDQMSVSFDIEERRRPPNEWSHSAMSLVSPNYFSTLGIALLKGRHFTMQDDERHPPVVLVNQAFADKFFPGENVLGKRIEPGATNGAEGTKLREIVGVVGNARQSALAPNFQPIYYFPYAQMTWFFGSVILKTDGAPRTLEASVRKAVAGLDGQAPVYDVHTMDELGQDSLRLVRFPSVLLLSFAAITLVLTAIGLYGILTYLVEMRRREFGIRMALGAAPAAVLSVVLRSAGLLLTLGLLAGGSLSLLAQRGLRSLPFLVTESAPSLLSIALCVLIAVGLLAALVPAWRAATINPTETLRME